MLCCGINCCSKKKKKKKKKKRYKISFNSHLPDLNEILHVALITEVSFRSVLFFRL